MLMKLPNDEMQIELLMAVQKATKEKKAALEQARDDNRFQRQKVDPLPEGPLKELARSISIREHSFERADYHVQSSYSFLLGCRVVELSYTGDKEGQGEWFLLNVSSDDKSDSFWEAMVKLAESQGVRDSVSLDSLQDLLYSVFIFMGCSYPPDDFPDLLSSERLSVRLAHIQDDGAPIIMSAGDFEALRDAALRGALPTAYGDACVDLNKTVVEATVATTHERARSDWRWKRQRPPSPTRAWRDSALRADCWAAFDQGN